VQTKPLREASIRQLRALLDEEAAHWDDELHWDWTAVRTAVAGGIERGTLGGRVATDGVRALAYSYYLADGSRVILGSIFCAREHRGRGIESDLVDVVVADARRERGSSRVECQTLFCTDEGANARFPAAGFASRRRHYMLLDLGRVRPSPPPPVPAGFQMRPLLREDLHAAAEVVYRSHVATLDAALNLTYATPAACRGFVDTLVLRAGCGRFDTEASRIVDGPKGPVAALVASRLSRTNGHVCQVSVVPEAQGRGLGLLLMAHALQAFDRQGLATATLSVTVDNARAHRLYSMLGFVVHREFGAHAWVRPPGQVVLPE
jgi:ribosomal protein S18 acetylase RimI-like enzyme